MVAVKIEQFGGMRPAVDDGLLDPNAAALGKNTWLYTGAAEGINSLAALYTCRSAAARKVFRIPLGFYDTERFANSYWMEFQDPDTDVVRTPVANDSFDRYYWASSSHRPLYNPQNRITAAQKGGTATITIASPAVVTLAGHGLVVGDPVPISTTGALPTPLINNRCYFVQSVISPDTFTIADVPGGPAIATSGTQSGTHTALVNQPLFLGVPAPVSAPTLAIAGGSGVVSEARAYVYTWVTEYGEEGPPSPPSTTTTGLINATWTVTLPAPSNDSAANRKLKFINIYRAVTSSTGVATFFFVAQQPIGTATYPDSTVDVSGNNQLQSTFWDPPSDDLKGMIVMPNGMVAGFRSNEVWFCEPYRPHAWPAEYSVSVDYPIIGLGVIGQSLIVCTAVSPYSVSGINPAVMSISRISLTAPCLSRGSILSTPNGVVYCTNEGLVIASPGQVQIVTKNLVDKSKWGDLLPVPTLRAALLNDAYYCWGSSQGTVFQPDAFQADAFQGEDITGGFIGGLIDFLSDRVAYNILTTDLPVLNVMTDVWTGEVFVIKDGVVYWLDLSDGRPREVFKWRSKIFSTPNRRNLQAMRVWFDTYPDSPTLHPNPERFLDVEQTLQPDQYGLVRVYADDRLVMCRELRENGGFMRLPSGFKAATYQIEIEARVKITSIEASTSASELISV